MNAKTFIAGTSIALALAAAAATPANAVITTFASFNPNSSQTTNFYYQTGTSAFYTTATAASKVSGGTLVTFSFLNEGGTLNGAVSNVTALLTLNGTGTGPVVYDAGEKNVYQDTSANFQITSTTAITVGSHTYAAGSNLLSGIYTNANLIGKGFSANLNPDNEAPDTLSFTSDFVTFVPTAALSATLGINSVTPKFPKIGSTSFPSFKGDLQGTFGADPVPLPNGVPEPASWALMVVGFGLAGASLRRRVRAQVAA